MTRRNTAAAKPAKTAEPPKPGPVLVKIAKGAALNHEGRTYHADATLTVPHEDALSLIRAGTAYAYAAADTLPDTIAS